MRRSLSSVYNDCIGMARQDGRRPARGVGAEPPRRAIGTPGDASDRLSEMHARMVDHHRRSHELQHASAQLRARSRELLARAHEHVGRASALRSQRRLEGAGITSYGGIA